MGLDQFYTRRTVAERCITSVKSMIDIDRFQIIEPSAGNGSFLSLLPPGSIGYDLDPKCPGIIEQDFLTLNHTYSNVLYIGNPPFGKCARTALEFINKCAKSASYVCMILPRTFSKIFFQNRIDLNLHLIYEDNLPPNSFISEGKMVDVPCVFQIWEKRPDPREELRVINKYFESVSENDSGPDVYAIRRVGGKAGTVLDGLDHSRESTMFVRDLIPGTRDNIILLYPILLQEASKTVGPRSITQNEIVYYLNHLRNK